MLVLRVPDTILLKFYVCLLGKTVCLISYAYLDWPFSFDALFISMKRFQIFYLEQSKLKKTNLKTWSPVIHMLCSLANESQIDVISFTTWQWLFEIFHQFFLVEFYCTCQSFISMESFVSHLQMSVFEIAYQTTVGTKVWRYFHHIQ